MSHAQPSPTPVRAPRIAVLVPCLNEEATIGKVVDDFRAALPEAVIYVFDNASTDRTAEIAAAHGATVVAEPRRGKGYVVDAMFQRVEADVYVLVDGDDTYEAARARELVAPVLAGQVDMAVGTRLTQYGAGSFRHLHVWGNRLLTGIVNRTFKTSLTDMLSGYRAMSRRLVKTVPILSEGFEVETELTLRTLERKMSIAELPLDYHARPAGSVSKLRTFRDGFRVVLSILNITRSYRPLTFFGAIGAVFLAGGLVSGGVVIQDFMVDRYVEHVPLAILATGCSIVAFLAFGIGIVLDTLSERFREISHLLREPPDTLP